MLNWVIAVFSLAGLLIGLIGAGMVWEMRESDRRELSITKNAQVKTGSNTSFLSAGPNESAASTKTVARRWHAGLIEYCRQQGWPTHTKAEARKTLPRTS